MNQNFSTALAGTAGFGLHYVRTALAQLWDALLDNRAPAMAMTLYATSLYVYIKVFSLEEMAYFDVYGSLGVSLFILTLFLFLITYCIRLQLRDKPERLIPHVAQSLGRDIFTWSRFFNGAIGIGIFLLLMMTFANFKRMIPEVVPFHYDVLFHDLDRAIHFGMDPWAILQPLLGHPAMTFGINFLYNIWLFIIIMVFYWQCFATDNRQLRTQYMLSFILCWGVIGTLAATLLSSAGPCFYFRFVDGEDVYAPLMNYLRSANEVFPIWALDMQNTLLRGYETKSTAIASGITAMPSMHVSLAWLMALLGWRTSRFAGWAFTTYCGFIMIGSVHLGWHYAIDGYVSIVLTTLIWLASGWISRHASRRTPDKATYIP